MTKNTKMMVVVVAAVIAAGLIGWRLGSSKRATNSTASSATSTASSDSAAAGDPRSLVSYTLPDGWKEGTCPNAANKVFIVPSGSSLQCDSAAIAPVRIYIDPQNTKDCQQLNAPQNVKKHICKSLFINGHKTLQASTETDNTVSDYYIDTGKNVIKVEYTYTTNNAYQTGFDQLANSVKVK
jgi:hypothetical protein